MFFWIALFVLLALYFLGPRAPRVHLDRPLPDLPDDFVQLEKHIAEQEALDALRPNTEARIIWANPQQPVQTPYSLVYIHGFSASQGEGDPLHKEFAARYGCNLFFGRLQGHGTQSDQPLADLSPDGMLESARYALAVGQKIGKQVILMGTSTGCTLMMYLAGRFPHIAGLICYSPNVAVRNPYLKYVTRPWGQYLVWLLNRGEIVEKIGVDNDYWDRRYHIRALVSLQSLLQATMQPALFQSIRQPFFMGYYYKDEVQQDQTVSVPAMLEMFGQLGTPIPQKQKVAFPHAGDHAFPNQFYGQDLDAVRKATFAFAEDILKLPKVPL